MEEKKVSIQKSIIWNSAGSMVYLITQWLISVLVVRLSGVETAGILTLAMSVNNVFYSIAMQGIRNYQVSDMKEKYTSGIYVSSRLIICILSFLVCVGYALIAGYSYGSSLCIVAYCLFKMAEAFYDVYAGICQKKWRMDWIGLVSWLVIFFYDIPRAKKLDTIKIHLKEKKNITLMAECFPLLCYQTMSSVIPTIPRLVMEKILGGAALGIYGSVAAPTMIVQMGASYVFNPFITLFAEQYSSGNIRDFWKTFRKCMAAILLISVVALGGGKIFGHWGLELLYGDEVAAHEDLLLPLIGCTILTAIVWFLCALLTVVREIKGLVICNVIILPVSYFGAYLLIQQYGMQGGSISLAVSYLIEIGALWFWLLRKIKQREKQHMEQ